MSLLREAFDEIMKESKLNEMNNVDKHFINRQENIDQVVKDLVDSLDNITPELAKSIARVGLMNKNFILAKNIKPEDFINAVGKGVANTLENKAAADTSKTIEMPKKDYIPFNDKSIMAKGYYNKTGKLSPKDELLKSKEKALHDFKTEDEKKAEIKKALPIDFDELDPWEKLKYMVQKDKLQRENVDKK